MATVALRQELTSPSDMGQAFFERRLFVAAAQSYAEWRQEAESIRGWPVRDRVQALAAHGALALAVEAYVDAAALCRTARALARRSKAARGKAAWVALYLGAALDALGQGEAALAWIKTARRECDGLPAGCGERVDLLAGQAALAQGLCEVGLGRCEAACVTLEQAAGWLGGHDRQGQAEALIGLARLARENRDVPKAWASLNRALVLLEGERSSLVAAAHAELGLLSFAEGDCQAAARHGGMALEILWLRSGLLGKVELAKLCELFGLISWATGDRQAAIAFMQRSATYFLQRNRWREWQRASSRLREWTRERGKLPCPVHAFGHREKRTLKGYRAVLGLLDTLEGLSPAAHRRAGFVAHYALLLAEAAGCGEEDRLALSHAARFYEIGYTAADERSQVQFALLGEQILSAFPVPPAVGRAVRYVGERFDGRGQPEGLAGQAIPRVSRIIAISDAYVRGADKAACLIGQGGHTAGMAALLAEVGTRFDPALVEAFAAMHDISS